MDRERQLKLMIKKNKKMAGSKVDDSKVRKGYQSNRVSLRMDKPLGAQDSNVVLAHDNMTGVKATSNDYDEATDCLTLPIKP